MFNSFDRRSARERRHLRVRKRVAGTLERPRLSVFRSLKHISAQIIDDQAGHTLVSVSTVEPEVRKEVGRGSNVEAARAVGKLLAKRALEKGIKSVIFDRGGNIYHGRVAAFADGAREGGLEF
ncbi:MAG: 50S ribosomal protein L18 [Firmicutes bacterium]|nr:50S ribosomal protein L18 [Bacillota bacterium]